MKDSNLLEISCRFEYDEHFGIDVDVEIPDGYWTFKIMEFRKVLQNLAHLPSQNLHKKAPFARLVIGKDHKWRVFVYPSSLIADDENKNVSVVEFTFLEFSRIPEEVVKNFRTIKDVRRYAETLE